MSTAQRGSCLPRATGNKSVVVEIHDLTVSAIPTVRAVADRAAGTTRPDTLAMCGAHEISSGWTTCLGVQMMDGITAIVAFVILVA